MQKTKTRALSLLLVLALVLGLSPGTVWAAGEDTVTIGTAEELEAFRDRVNAGEKDLCAILTADIELSGEWTPFNPSDGYITNAYAGTFDGNGHTIRNVNIQDSSANGVGFFGTVNGAAIQNLRIEGAITASNSSFVGGIVGKTQGAVTIANCSFSGTVNSGKTGSNAGAGGIVGRVNAGTVTITGCANSADISGGCAGGILGYCSAKGSVLENCYNIGTISGSNRTGGIAGQVYSTTEITNCFTTKGVVCGFNGNLTNCYDEADPPTDASQLGSAFTTDAEGNVVLSWQAGAAPAPKDPHITLTGSGSLYMTNSGPQPTGTLTVRYTDMEAVPVTWSITSGNDVISLRPPENADANNSTQTLSVLKSGKATVKAEAGGHSDEIEITVWPFVTTVEIEGAVAVGQTVKAKINVLGGGELDYSTFPVTVQWKYKATAVDTVFTEIKGSTAQEFTIPEDMEGQYLSFTYRYQSEDKSPSSPSLIKAAGETNPSPQPPASDKALDEALAWYTMYPVFGQDTNVNRVLEQYLQEKGLDGFTASVQSVEEVYGGGKIAENGDITYFYTDPNTTPAVKFGSYRVTFILSKGGEALEKEIPVILYWDAARVKETMRQEISGKVVLDVTAPVIENLTLPKVVDGKRWALISWTSSNEDVISISTENQTTADTLFEPYVGVVRRGETDQQVTLTAVFTFQFTNDGTGSEAPITLVNTYSVTVKALDAAQEEQIRAGLLAKLDAGFAARGLTDAVTGARLTPDADGVYTAVNDIQFPTTHDFGVDGKYYPVVITTSGEALRAPDVNNAARAEVYRPGAGRPDCEGVITVTLHDRDTSVTASREFKIKVPALTQEEINAELALMERVKAAYFDGIKGSNSAKDNVRTDLAPFLEVYEGADGQLVWVRTKAEQTGQGIIPVPMDGWEDLELWRLFRSSNPNVISHENLIVTRQAEAKAVTISSRLSSETLGRYGELYAKDPVQYAQYASLAPLYYQEVTTDTVRPASRSARTAAPAAQSAPETIVVRGTKDPNSAVPVVETIDVTFTLTGLDGAEWISTSFTGLDEASTVYDVFVKALGGGYTAVREKGTYIKAISGPLGTLTEKEYGADSGWMYRVNGSIPDVYMGACPLRSGDSIQVFYTRDANVDDPGYSRPSSGNPSNGGSGSSSTTNSASSQTVQITKNTSDGTYRVALSQDGTGPQLVILPEGSAGQLVVIVREDGSEEVVKKSILEDNKAKFLLEKGACVKLVNYTNPFDDVPGEAWYRAAVDFTAGRGLFVGTSGQRFAPELSISRGMLAAVLFRLEDAEAPTAPSQFADVPDGAWYTQGVIWAAENGIASGYGNGNFGPNAPITREQLALMLFQYAKTLDMSTSGRDSLTSFADSDAVSAWAQDAMAWAVDCGIINGLPNGTLAPSRCVSRAEAAVMLQHFIAVLLK